MVDRILTTGQAAELCSVDRRTVLRWVHTGILPGYRTGGERTRIRYADLLAFMSERGMPLPAVEAAPPVTPRIGIVDDQAAVVRAIKRLVLRAFPDVEIASAGDGFAAGVLATSFRPHLLFLDVIMPGIDGVEVCRRIRADQSLHDMAVVIVSGMLDPRLERRLLDAGADRVIAKPFDPAEVLRAVTDLAILPARAPRARRDPSGRRSGA